jgi:hypothetical protein
MKRLSIVLLPLFFLFGLSLKAQQAPIGLSINDVKAKKGDQVCLPVNLYNFRNMLSMQYTIKFDPNQLHFIGVIDQKMPYMNTSNFGLHNAQKGEITVVWIDNSLQGVTKAEGESAFTLCFNVKADAGEEIEVNFTDQPTPFESVNVNEQIIPINTKKGTIKVEK